MEVSQNGIDFIEGFEDLRTKAYPDPKTKASPYTIGFGTTHYPSGMPVHLGDVCTPQQATQYLINDLEYFCHIVNSAVDVPLSQNQFDAMVSIVQNVGPGSSSRSGIIRLTNGQPSTLLRKLNAKDYAGAADAFLQWVSPGSDVENGLRRRRTAERAMFLS